MVTSYPAPPRPVVEAVVPDDKRTHIRNHAAWGAILAGVVAALIVQLVLNILGVGLGASSVDAMNTGDNPSASGAGTITAIWIVVSGIVASLVGGVVAGRLSGTSDGNTARWHGFLSWCVATLCIFYLLSTAAGGLIGGAASALGGTVSAVGRGAASTVSGVAANTDGDALKSQVQRLVNPNDAQTAQDNITSYIRASVSGDKAAADAARDRAVDSLARTANISPDDARARLQQAETQARQAADTVKQKAQVAAEATRKGVASAGILGFVALALGALAAWFGGGIGAPRAETRVVPTSRTA
ncbi:MAG: hypothetical protein ACRYHQ_10980 [Janthinobacterium lividum]